MWFIKFTMTTTNRVLTTIRVCVLSTNTMKHAFPTEFNFDVSIDCSRTFCMVKGETISS